MLESKRVSWQFEVEGQADEARDEREAIEEAVSEYGASSQTVKKALGKVNRSGWSIRH